MGKKLASRSGLGWNGKKNISVFGGVGIGLWYFSFVGFRSHMGLMNEWMSRTDKWVTKDRIAMDWIGMDGYMISPIADPGVSYPYKCVIDGSLFVCFCYFLFFKY